MLNTMIFSKPVESLEIEDIQVLIEEQIQESLNLDYKRDFSRKKNGNIDTKELAKDVSSFANSRGGYLIYGVECTKGDSPKNICGIPYDPNKKFKENIEQRIRTSIQKKVRTRIRVIPYQDNSCLVVIYVLRSIDAPHRVEVDKDYKYYKRGEYESAPMEEYEIRHLYDINSTLKKKIDAELDDKYADILEKSNVPLFSLGISTDFLEDELIEISNENTERIEEIGKYIIQNTELTITNDGYIITSPYKHRTLKVYKNGTIVFAKLLGSENEIDYIDVAKRLSELLERTKLLFNEIGYYGNIHLKLYFNDIEDYMLKERNPLKSDPITKRFSIDIYDPNIKKTVKELMDELFRFFGHSESTCFDESYNLISSRK